jgi:NAD(P)-dependent dehydrogenase (short-subunit alcohol dehydrogenase family)
MPSVFITGANRGLGLEFARQYAADGWQVIAACRQPAAATALAELGAEVVGLDIGDFASIAGLSTRLAGRPIDLLINNAGVYGAAQDFNEIDPVEWERVLKINSIAPLKVTQALLPNLLAGQRRLVAFLSSLLGSIAKNDAGGQYYYRSSKAALNAAVKSLSIDLAGQGVTALLLHPGWVKTDMGGAGAPLTPTESITGLRRVLAAAGPADNGGFVDYNGVRLPW